MTDDERITYAAAALAADDNARMPAKQWARSVAQDMAEDTMTDTPKHYTVYHPVLVGDRGVRINDRAHCVAIDGQVSYPTAVAAIAAAEAHRAAVVADSPELAQANERIAALEADLDAACQAIIALRDPLDAALARVAELEAELAEVPSPFRSHGWGECKARIRADERARTECDIVAHFNKRRGDTTDDILDDVKRGAYNREGT
ncbi:MAG: hypothetical protein ACRCZP_19870 [Phycicoccus sp.]